MYDLRFSQRRLWRRPSSETWRRIDFVWTNVSGERISWRCRRYVPPKRLFTQDLHGAASLKTAVFTKILIFFQKQYFCLRVPDLKLYRIYLNFFAVALNIQLQMYVILLSEYHARLVRYGCWYTEAISNAKLQETLHFERSLGPDASLGFVVLTWSSGR
jgi:hypothetical protein